MNGVTSRKSLLLFSLVASAAFAATIEPHIEPKPEIQPHKPGEAPRPEPSVKLHNGERVAPKPVGAEAYPEGGPREVVDITEVRASRDALVQTVNGFTALPAFSESTGIADSVASINAKLRAIEQQGLSPADVKYAVEHTKGLLTQPLSEAKLKQADAFLADEKYDGNGEARLGNLIKASMALDYFKTHDATKIMADVNAIATSIYGKPLNKLKVADQKALLNLFRTKVAEGYKVDTPDGQKRIAEEYANLAERSDSGETDAHAANRLAGFEVAGAKLTQDAGSKQKAVDSVTSQVKKIRDAAKNGDPATLKKLDSVLTKLHEMQSKKGKLNEVELAVLNKLEGLLNDPELSAEQKRELIADCLGG